jgi:hypothetical protein
MLAIGYFEREPSSDHTPGHTQEMEDDDRGSDPGEGAVQRLVVSELLDERRAKPDPQEARDKGGPGRQQPAEDLPR